MLFDNLVQRVLLSATVTHGNLFIHGIEAAERSYDVRTVWRDETAGHSSAGFKQFARDCDIDVADAGRKGQHRTLSAEFAQGDRQYFDVISRRAGALRDAGNRRALHRKSRLYGGANDPFRQHAAAFATKGCDQDRNRTRRAHALASPP